MPMPAIDITGVRFGKLVAIRLDGKMPNSKSNAWLCLCDCGNYINESASVLKSGKRATCGCGKREKRKPRPDLAQRNKDSAKHGMAGSKTYASWSSMKARCESPNDKDYNNYGGRGISVCREWSNSFSAFLRDMGERPENTTLDRIDVNGPYSPENTRWANAITQSNNRRTNLYIEYNGTTKTATEWAREFNLEAKTLLYRIKAEWPIEVALTTPPIIRRK